MQSLGYPCETQMPPGEHPSFSGFCKSASIGGGAFNESTDASVHVRKTGHIPQRGLGELVAASILLPADKPGISGQSSHHRAHQRHECGRTEGLTIAMLNCVTKNPLALSSISLSSSLIMPT